MKAYCEMFRHCPRHWGHYGDKTDPQGAYTVVQSDEQ